MMSRHSTPRGNNGPRFRLPRTAPRASPRQPSARRGTTLVLAVLLTVTVVSMAAFAVDVGYIVHYRTHMQRAADASALAAAEVFSDYASATALAHDVADENGWDDGVKIGDGDAEHGEDLDPMMVEYGFWNRTTATFTTPSPAGVRTNAVRVTLRRTEATRNPLPLFFARVLGQSVTDVTVSATAWCEHGVCGPFVGIEWLDVGGGANTDSFDSELATYSPATAGYRGSICSDGPVTVGGNPIVKGDALAGENSQVIVSNNPIITGYIGNRISPLNLPPVDASVAAVVNNNDNLPPLASGLPALDQHGRFNLNNGEVYDLPPGTYYFDSVRLNGGSTLNLSGPTTIYVTGDFTRAGGAWVNNNTQLAENFQILGVGSNTYDVTSDNDFYGVIYAPQSRITLNGDADLYGAVVGNTLKMNGTGWGHYDESLDLEHLGVATQTMLVD